MNTQNSIGHHQLRKTALILLIVVLTVVILVYGKPFLVPLVFAALLSSLLLPVSKWFERKGVTRSLSVIFSISILFVFVAGLIFLLSWQLSDMAQDLTKIESELTNKYHQLQNLISEKLGISQSKQEEMLKQQKSSAPGKTTSMVTGIIAGIGGFLTDTILAIVYIFLFLYFRGYLKRFILRVVPSQDEDKAKEIINGSQKVTQKYLTGLSMMIALLWVMYGIGFTIAGVKSPLLFAILCGLLEIVPFVGNIAGTTVTVVVSLIQGGDTNVIIGILVTYGFVQFIQTYIIEPMIVGSEVNINPLFTIIALVAGEMVWGIPGMVLSIPLMGIAKIVSDHVEPLKPFAELIGIDKEKKEGNLKKKIKRWTDKILKLFHKK